MLELDFKKNKTVYINLLAIPGISHTTAIKLCAIIGVSKNTLYSNLSAHKLDKLNLLLNSYSKKSSPFTLTHVSDLHEGTSVGTTSINLNHKSKLGVSQIMLHMPIMHSLEEYRKKNILKLIETNTYRGRRFKYGYPVKGQRTRCNANSAKRINRKL